MRVMNPEERFERIERQMEFLAANQAENSAQIAANSLQIAKNSKQIEENSKLIEGNSQQITQLTELTLRIGRIVEVQAGRMDALAESERRTDERLSALINVVERYFSNGRH